MAKKPKSLLELMNLEVPTKKCKTDFSKNKSESNKANTIIKELRTFEDYMKDIKWNYFTKFKKTLKDNSENDKKNVVLDKLQIMELFEKKMPIISGKTKISKLSSLIKAPENQYFINKIYKEIIEILCHYTRKPYPTDNKYGLVYFLEEEWIYFKIEEIYYQKYISETNRVMSLLYENFQKHILNPNDLFTENDEYILPSSVKGLDYERNVFQYFQLKTKLKEGPDILIRTNFKNDKFFYNRDIKVTFDEYVNSIKFSYFEIDGSLINNTKNQITISSSDNPVIYLYQEIIVDSIEKKDNITYNCKISNENKDEIIIPRETVVLFQIKSQGPTNLLNKNSLFFDKEKLTYSEIKKELSIVLYKMILYGNYFYELYKELKLIDKNYNVQFFLIFNNYRIEDISKEIHQCINILIDKNKVNYPFSIKPIYVNSSVNLINSKIITENNEIKEKRREEEEKKRKKDLENLQSQMKELMEKQEKEKRRREEEEKRREEEEKRRREEEEKRRNKDFENFQSQIKELLQKQEEEKKK